MNDFAAGAGPRRIDTSALPLAWEPVPEGQRVAGDPLVGATEVAVAPGVEVGVWSHTPGVSTDVEVDEVFVVLSGRATIEFSNGTVMEVGPGDVGVLPSGATTRWTVYEELRKVYVIRS